MTLTVNDVILHLQETYKGDEPMIFVGLTLAQARLHMEMMTAAEQDRVFTTLQREADERMLSCFLSLIAQQLRADDEEASGACICCRRPGSWRKLTIYVRLRRSLLSFCDKCCERDDVFEGATPMQIWTQEARDQPFTSEFMSFLMAPTGQYTFDEYHEYHERVRTEG